MLRSYKYRLYPTLAQAELINKHIGACRFVYNLALETKNYAYATQRKNLSVFELMRQMTQLKKECDWINEVDSQTLQQSLLNLDKAFTRFFKGQSSFPKFKKKRAGASFRNPHGQYISIKDKRIYQCKFRDGILATIDRPHKGKIRSTTISKTPTGKYFISLLCETGIDIPKKKAIKDKTTIGIDLGLKSFIVTSNGEITDNPKHLKKSLSRLKFLQRQGSKKKLGSYNRKKANHKIALQHEKITNQRKDFLHKLSTKLINNHDTLCFETLNIAGMVKNHNLAQSISDASWAKFVEFCKYKAEWYGKNILQIPTFEPSTKMCHVCGQTNNNLTLADRHWTCLKCGTAHDRDINAAINIKNYSLKNCGGVHRGKSVELPTMVGAMKQKKNASRQTKNLNNEKNSRRNRKSTSRME